MTQGRSEKNRIGMAHHPNKALRECSGAPFRPSHMAPKRVSFCTFGQLRNRSPQPLAQPLKSTRGLFDPNQGGCNLKRSHLCVEIHNIVGATRSLLGINKDTFVFQRL